jgi:hypothetical protein
MVTPANAMPEAAAAIDVAETAATNLRLEYWLLFIFKKIKFYTGYCFEWLKIVINAIHSSTNLANKIGIKRLVAIILQRLNIECY